MFVAGPNKHDLFHRVSDLADLHHFARTPVSVTLIQSSTSPFVQVPNHDDGCSVCYPLFGPHKYFVDRCEPGIRTYSAVPLNEECVLIEWVRNTIPVRLYDRRSLTLHVSYEYYLFVLTDLLRYLGKRGNRCGGEGKDYERRGCSKTFRRAGLNL